MMYMQNNDSDFDHDSDHDSEREDDLERESDAGSGTGSGRGGGGERGAGRREGTSASRSSVDRASVGDGGGRPGGMGERRRTFQNADELLLDEVKSRAQRASVRLKECILGTFLIELTNGKRYGFDCRQAEMVVAPLTGDLGAHAPPDCSIRLSEDNLLRIASGDLNPQVGMLSDKIRVQGKSSIAVYFFNLIAPRSN